MADLSAAKMCKDAWANLAPKTGADPKKMEGNYETQCYQSFVDAAERPPADQCLYEDQKSKTIMTEAESVTCVEQLAVRLQWVKLQTGMTAEQPKAEEKKPAEASKPAEQPPAPTSAPATEASPEVKGFCKDFVARLKTKAAADKPVDEANVVKACEELAPKICSGSIAEDDVELRKDGVGSCLDAKQGEITARANALAAEKAAADKPAAEKASAKPAEEPKKDEPKPAPEPAKAEPPKEDALDRTWAYMRMFISYGTGAGFSVNHTDPVLDYKGFGYGVEGGALLTPARLGKGWEYHTKTGLKLSRFSMGTNKSNPYSGDMSVWGLGPAAAAIFSYKIGNAGRLVLAPEFEILPGSVSTYGPVDVGLTPYGKAYEAKARTFVTDFYLGVMVGLEADECSGGGWGGFNISAGLHTPAHNDPVTNTPTGMDDMKISLKSWFAIQLAFTVFL